MGKLTAHCGRLSGGDTAETERAPARARMMDEVFMMSEGWSRRELVLGSDTQVQDSQSPRKEVGKKTEDVVGGESRVVRDAK